MKFLGKKQIVLGLTILVLIIVGFGVSQEIKKTRNQENNKSSFSVQIPLKYDKPLVIQSFGNILNIRPANARSSEMVRMDDKTIK